MKLIFLALAMLLSFTVFAETFPEKITCRAETKSIIPRSFEIIGLDTIDPVISLPEVALLQSPDLWRDTYEVAFANGSESAYSIKLLSRDLLNLKARYIKSVKGTLDYFNDKNAELVTFTCSIQ